VHLTDEGSGSELDEPPESTIKKKLIISAGDGTYSNQLCGLFNR
jgi:hypothetical protein